MASGEMTNAEFPAFNDAWMAAVSPHIFVTEASSGTLLHRQAGLADRSLGLHETPASFLWISSFGRRPTPAWAASIARSTACCRCSKKGTASHVNNVDLGKRGRWRSNVWTLLQAPRRRARLRRSPRPSGSPDRKADRDARGRPPRPHKSGRHRHRSVPRLRLEPLIAAEEPLAGSVAGVELDHCSATAVIVAPV